MPIQRKNKPIYPGGPDDKNYALYLGAGYTLTDVSPEVTKLLDRLVTENSAKLRANVVLRNKVDSADLACGQAQRERNDLQVLHANQAESIARYQVDEQEMEVRIEDLEARLDNEELEHDATERQAVALLHANAAHEFMEESLRKDAAVAVDAMMAAKRDLAMYLSKYGHTQQYAEAPVQWMGSQCYVKKSN